MKARGMRDGGALGQAVEWLFDEKIFTDCRQHGNTEWRLGPLTVMALLWAWGGQESLQERFARGLEILPRLYRQRRWGRTYQGFMKSLGRWSGQLRAALLGQLQARMRTLAGEHWTTYGWVVMAVDGTRVAAPRTEANQKHFDRALPRKRRRKRSRRKVLRKPKRQPAGPQVWLTVMWHVGLGLLWDWRQGPSGSSERAHLEEMMGALPERSLLVADAGFQGYDIWRKLLDRGHSFVIRVAGQVRLLEGLGMVRRCKDIVYLWPDKARKRHQPPIILRLFEFHDGRRSVWLVTNVLDDRRLSQRQALEIYRRRWGVEIFIRSLKQTFGRGTLRSHAPQNVELELDWSLLALWSMELLAIRELLARGRPPQDASTAGALRAIRQALTCAAVGIDFDLSGRLAAIRHDGYRRRQKAIRNWPRKKPGPSPGRPDIRYASLNEIKAAHELQLRAA